MADALLSELDALGVTLGTTDGRPFLRVPAGLPPRYRADLLQRVAARREAVIAHLAARPAAPLPEAWECVVCGRGLTPDVIPLLAGPHYCPRGAVRGRVTTADGAVFEPRDGCPFKGADL